MNLDEFWYDLPSACIAQFPLKKRDQAKLLVVERKNGRISHDIFANIGNYLPAKSCLVFNNTKVIHARLLSQRKTGGKVEIFLLKRLEDGYTYETMLRPFKRLKIGETITFQNGLRAEIIDKEKKIVRFNKKNIAEDLKRIGHVPLPPYIQRLDRAIDKTYYQTVYAKKEGSVASPTAGLHFTNVLISKLKRSGHRFIPVTLNVNYATFKPVEAFDITKHKIHSEYYEVTSGAHQSIVKAKAQGRSIVAIGTTSCRVLETLAQGNPLKGESKLFIYPGYNFTNTDCLITNFHLPFSTLLMLVYAFGGIDLMKRAYQEAIKHDYRFYSYGDAMMIV